MIYTGTLSGNLLEKYHDYLKLFTFYKPLYRRSDSMFSLSITNLEVDLSSPIGLKGIFLPTIIPPSDLPDKVAYIAAITPHNLNPLNVFYLFNIRQDFFHIGPIMKSNYTLIDRDQWKNALFAKTINPGNIEQTMSVQFGISVINMETIGPGDIVTGYYTPSKEDASKLAQILPDYPECKNSLFYDRDKSLSVICIKGTFIAEKDGFGVIKPVESRIRKLLPIVSVDLDDIRLDEHCQTGIKIGRKGRGLPGTLLEK